MGVSSRAFQGWLGAVAVVGLAYSQSDTPKDDLAAKREVWSKTLKTMFASTKRCVVADVDLNAPLPISARIDGDDEDARSAIAAPLLHREARSIKEGWAYIRGPYTSAVPRNDYALTARWLSSVSDDELRRLSGNGLSLSDMSPQGRALFTRLCGHPGIQHKIARGEFVRATVRLRIVARTNDAQGKPRSVVVDSLAASSSSEIEAREKQEGVFHASQRSAQALPPSEQKALVGELDLREGRLLSVGEVAQLAQVAFGRTYLADGRVWNSMTYWQGRFTKDRFLDAFRTVTATLESGEVPQTLEEYQAQVDAILRTRIAKLVDPGTAPGDLAYQDALNGKQLSAKELSVTVRGLMGALSGYGLTPSARFTLMPAVAFSLSASGNYRDPARPDDSPVTNVWSTVLLP